jgi:hypothetical protein
MLRPSVLISSINLPSALSATISLSPAIFLKILVSCVVVSPFDTGVLLDISFFLSYQYELLLKWMGQYSIPVSTKISINICWKVSIFPLEKITPSDFSNQPPNTI